MNIIKSEKTKGENKNEIKMKNAVSLYTDSAQYSETREIIRAATQVSVSFDLLILVYSLLDCCCCHVKVEEKPELCVWSVSV